MVTVQSYRMVRDQRSRRTAYQARKLPVASVAGWPSRVNEWLSLAARNLPLEGTTRQDFRARREVPLVAESSQRRLQIRRLKPVARRCSLTGLESASGRTGCGRQRVSAPSSHSGRWASSKPPSTDPRDPSKPAGPGSSSTPGTRIQKAHPVAGVAWTRRLPVSSHAAWAPPATKPEKCSQCQHGCCSAGWGEKCMAARMQPRLAQEVSP
jgi:hypothetical protein